MLSDNKCLCTNENKVEKSDAILNKIFVPSTPPTNNPSKSPKNKSEYT